MPLELEGKLKKLNPHFKAGYAACVGYLNRCISLIGREYEIFYFHDIEMLLIIIKYVCKN
jgi:hypothetical protein